MSRQEQPGTEVDEILHTLLDMIAAEPVPPAIRSLAEQLGAALRKREDRRPAAAAAGTIATPDR